MTPHVGRERAADAQQQRPAADENKGTQSIERSLRVMRELAARGEFGWRLSDLAARCEIDKGTLHRMLACLVRERFVAQRPTDKHYFPGPMLYELSLSIPGYGAFQRACEARLAHLAGQMDAIAWLALRSGNDFVCAARKGTLELRSFMVQVGTRRPLFTSVGGVAMLQTLPAEEARGVIDDNTRQEIAQRGDGRLADLARMRERSRAHGFGVNLGDVASGVHAFALPVCAAGGVAMAAVCLCGPPGQFGAARIDEVRQQLAATVAWVESDARETLGTVLQLGAATTGN
jgi:DNA-binding IclR family transcriptional regulator